MTVAGATLARAGAAEAKPERLSPAGQVVLRSAFHPLRGVDEMLASDDYALLAYHHGGGDTGWVVVNTRLRTRTPLPSDCHVDALGPPWLITACPSASDPSGPFDIELVSLLDGTQQRVTPGAGVPQCGWPPDEFEETVCASEPDGVGADWISWDATCYNCGDTSYFQNITTGEVRDDPTNATTFVDLNSPALARRTCPGVRLIRDFSNPAGVSWNALMPYGQWAVVAGHNTSLFLERCGTRMRQRLVGGATRVIWNSTSVVWQTRRSYLSGLLLPTLQRFTVPLPRAIAKQGTALDLQLNSDALYVRSGYYGTYWQTASPAALPLNTGRPSVRRSGGTLTCRRGTWRNADRFSYAWSVNGIPRKGAGHTLHIGGVVEPRSASCSVTAANAAGTTTASSAQ